MIGRIVFSGLISLFLLPIAALFGSLELATVDRAHCDWGRFDHICSDYEGIYGIIGGIVLTVWTLALWLINRKPLGEGK